MFRSKIHSAMMYPILVLSLTLVVGIGIAWFILPQLSVVFSQLKLELPLITKMLIGLGNFLGEWGFIAVPLFIMLLAGTLFVLFISEKTKWIGQWLLFHAPVISTVIQQIELSRFGYILGNLLDAGIPVVEALHSLSEATTFRAYKKFYTHIQDRVNEGNSFQKSFDLYPNIKPLMPATVQQMVASGEQSGNLSQMLNKIGITFEEKTETSTKKLSVLLEPILLLIVWGGVVMVALAVILPIYSLIGGLNESPSATSQPNTTKSAPSSGPHEQAEQKLPSLSISNDVPTLNVRTEPFGNIIQKVLGGDEYTYKTEKQNWYEIILDDGQTGWVSGDYVTLIKEDVAFPSNVAEVVIPAVSESDVPMVEILPTGTTFLNVRRNPSDVVVGKVEPGKRYPYVTKQSGWYQIRFDGDQEGWVLGKYVTPLFDE